MIASDFVRGSGFYLFELGYLNYFDIGYYLVIANLSDLAAMGARPTGLTTIVRYSKKMSDEDFKSVFKGIDAAAKDYGTEVVGGDIGGYSEDVFAATAFGIIKTSNALLRSRTKPGDQLCVTGKIGLPITALLYFKDIKAKGFSLPPEEEERILRSWRRPSARLKEGALLAETGLAHSCQDISDGLKATVEQISALSGCSFTIDAKSLPIDSSTRAMAEFLGVSSAQIAMSASVDFELVFTIAPHEQARCRDTFARHGLHFEVIGTVNSTGKNTIVSEEGNETILPGVPWVQQTDNYLSQIVKKV